MNFSGLKYQGTYLFFKTMSYVLLSLGRNILKLNFTMVFQDLNVLSDVEFHELCGSMSAQPAPLGRRSRKGGERQAVENGKEQEEGDGEQRGIWGLTTIPQACLVLALMERFRHSQPLTPSVALKGTAPTDGSHQ